MSNILVIKFYEQFALKVPGPPDSFAQWAVVTTGKDRCDWRRLKIKRVERAEALRVIRENRLVETHRDKDGVVFDTADRAFQRFHRGATVPFAI